MTTENLVRARCLGRGKANPAGTPRATSLCANSAAGHLPRVRTVTVLADDATPLAVTECGPATAALTVVFLHGHCLDQTSFRMVREGVIRRWGSSIRTVTYDHRGHGKSGVADTTTYTLEQLACDLAAILRAVAPVGPVLLVGHSMGGMTMLRYVREHAQVVGERLVGAALIATAAGDLSSHGIGKALRIPALSWFTTAATIHPPALHRLRDALNQFLPPVLWFAGCAPVHVSPWVDDVAHATVLNTTPFETITGFLPALSTLDEYAALAVLGRIPVTVICGTEDKLTPLAHSTAITAAIATARLVTVPGAGHLVVTQAPGSVASALNALIDRITSPAGRPMLRCG